MEAATAITTAAAITIHTEVPAVAEAELFHTPQFFDELVHRGVVFFEFLAGVGIKIVGAEVGFGCFGEIFRGVGHGIGAIGSRFSCSVTALDFIV